MKRYERLARDLAGLIESGVLRPGERLPSTRAIARAHRVSPATATQACYLLEDRGLVQARPRSGFYVNAHWRPAQPGLETTKPPGSATTPDVSTLVFEVLGSIRKRDIVPLGSAFPAPTLFPMAKLAQSLGRSARRMDPWHTVEGMSPGSAELRRQVAKRYAAHGVSVRPEEIVITAGALEALNLCLEAVTRPGDVVAIESPAFYAALQTIERLELRAVQLATHPVEGIDLASLAAALKRHRVAACWLMPTFQNPLGATMPVERKRELVRLLAKHEVPLVEDDVYAELHFGTDPLPPAKAFDASGLVMHCGSFSKSLAPGYRLGWCVPGRAFERVERLKLTTSIATSIPVQEGIADFLKHGGYDHHLRGLRARLREGQRNVLAAVATHFPAGTRVTRPEGGYFVWAEMPEQVDAMALHRAALEHGISVAPGPIFSARRRFGNCLRLNHGHPWEASLDQAVATLGRLARALARG
ncbi:MAG TPA: PLP-dependent aminotransferase family protein [Usitatibacter sp.]|nr:PLP-dependent aminotransferase family protein [Usitatibacter sp.]